MIHQLQQTQKLAVSAATAWQFFSDPDNLFRITPPEFKTRNPGGDLGKTVFEGQVLWFDIRLAPGIWKQWVTEITQVDPGRSFTDEQRSGPYRLWRHHHEILPIDAESCEVRDRVSYQLPLSPFSAPFHPLLVKPMLNRIFEYRREALQRLLVDEVADPAPVPASA